MSIVIVGAGPNLGAAIARRFGREGMPVGLVSRNREKLEALAEDLAQDGITATRVGIAFAGEVAYARMLHDELRDRGIHVGHTAIGGSIAPDGDHRPDDVADVLWRHHAERGEFQVRLGIDSYQEGR